MIKNKKPQTRAKNGTNKAINRDWNISKLGQYDYSQILNILSYVEYSLASGPISPMPLIWRYYLFYRLEFSFGMHILDRFNIFLDRKAFGNAHHGASLDRRLFVKVGGEDVAKDANGGLGGIVPNSTGPDRQ